MPNGLIVHGCNRNETQYLYQEIFEEQIYLPRDGADLGPAPVVFDVGANIGMFTLFAADRWPGARIFAFEPAPGTFEVLRRNVGRRPGVRACNIALGDRPQQRDLIFYPRYTMMSGFDADPAADRALVRAYVENIAAAQTDERRRQVLLDEVDELLEGRFDEPQTIPCTVERLDTVAAGLGVERIDLLKVDVEGFETQVLDGVGETLWPRIRHAVVEVEGRDPQLAAVLDRFARHGLRTTVEQPADYRGTEVFTVYAARTAP
ncbi:FkbM family methyltransferase [Dactylosporangium sp. CA-139114]|uniref:FkbM family methyltransferase n=1 Tax=Dactylosporangium sp. CA-139114 TaxID=3239931 RepID=UPI003D988B47